MKHNYLFATLISEFKYVPDDNLLNAIKNEEMKEKPISFHSKADMHAPHSHSNNIFSGVWYPFRSDIQTPIYFQDPRPSSGSWQPRVTKVNTLTTTLLSFKQQKDMGLIFPSWLVQYVPPAASPRISISWNVLLRGEYGEPDTLQNAHI